jgi:ParB-like chromosome segregation protein Spo0J
MSEGKRMKYPLHPACSIWPQMSPEALRELADDIRAHGLREPITLTPDGLLLDGRNRALACEMGGVEPMTVVYDGDPVEFSISRNKHRRHMDKTDLAFIGAKLATLKLGSNQHSEKVGLPEGRPAGEAQSVSAIAEGLGVSPGLVEDAKTIERDGSAEVIDLVKQQKKVGVRAAAKYVRRTPKAKQLADPVVIKTVVPRIRTVVQRVTTVVPRVTTVIPRQEFGPSANNVRQLRKQPVAAEQWANGVRWLAEIKFEPGPFRDSLAEIILTRSAKDAEIALQRLQAWIKTLKGE